jgi:predicted nucleic acid-binding protein
MSSKTFFDTNIIAYAFDRGNPVKRDRARDVVASCMRSGTLTISTQVLQEMFVVLTRKLKPAIPVDTAEKVLRWLSRNETVSIRSETILRSIGILKENRISFWDSLIVACAVES